VRNSEMRIWATPSESHILRQVISESISPAAANLARDTPAWWPVVHRSHASVSHETNGEGESRSDVDRCPAAHGSMLHACSRLGRLVSDADECVHRWEYRLFTTMNRRCPNYFSADLCTKRDRACLCSRRSLVSCWRRSVIQFLTPY